MRTAPCPECIWWRTAQTENEMRPWLLLLLLLLSKYEWVVDLAPPARMPFFFLFPCQSLESGK